MAHPYNKSLLSGLAIVTLTNLAKICGTTATTKLQGDSIVISNRANHLLFIEPKNPPTEPVIDSLTRKLTAAFRQAKPINPTRSASIRGEHGCTGKGCRATSDNCDYKLPGGLKTHRLGIHYLACHREEVPPSEIEKVETLACGEAEPTLEEVRGSRPKARRRDALRDGRR